MKYFDNHLDEIYDCGPLPKKKRVKDALELKERVQHILFRRLGATAVDVGFRIVEHENRFTNELAIRMHVKNKLGKEGKRKVRKTGNYLQVTQAQFQDLAGIPSKPTKDGRSIKLKGKRGYYRLDVIEARYIPSGHAPSIGEPRLNDSRLDEDSLLQLRRGRVRPLVGGISIGNQTGRAGTLGAVVWDEMDGEPCLLSNWHVLAGEATSVVGSPCYQPALPDGGRPSSDLVGHFKRGFLDRHGDAAMASISPDNPYCSGEVLGLWVPIAGTVEHKLGMPVRKWSRTTGFTRGFIDGIGFNSYLDFDGLGTQFFTDQIHIAPCDKGAEVSDPGDSGAIWVTKLIPKPLDEAQTSREDGKAQEQTSRSPVAGAEAPSRVYYAVGLNFAGDVPGPHSGEFAVASPIHDVAKRLQFSFRPYFFPRRSLVFVGGSRVSGVPSAGSGLADEQPLTRIPPG